MGSTAGSGVRVTGLRETIRKLERLGAATADLKDAMQAVAEPMKRAVDRFVPRRSGALAGTVRTGRAKNKASVRVGSARVPYAGANNWGWGTGNASYKHGAYATGIRGNYSGSGFLQKADDASKGQVLTVLDHELTNLIRKYDL